MSHSNEGPDAARSTLTPVRQPTKVAIVGAGNVGATAAYALLLSGLAAEIVLIDANQKRAEGEAMDLAHAVPFSRPTRVWAGDYEDLAGGAVITILAAGTGQRPGETRLDLARRNAAIVAEIVPRVAQANPDGIILVATNPVDVLTHAAGRISGLSASRVFGSGTTLDTGRFRALLGDHFRVDPRERPCVHHRRARRLRSAGLVQRQRRRCGSN